MKVGMNLALASTVMTSLWALPAQAASDADIDELRAIVEAQQDQIDSLLSGASSNTSRTTLGGYGEMHYNNLTNQTAGGDDKKEIDFHRFVLFVSHEFSDSIRFNSEVELEHSIAGEGQLGEIELEQAYIDFDLNDHHTARAGLFMIPVGIINETHEPDTFYGTERNPVEKYIVPATWWEGGAALYGELAPGVSYDLAVTSGLNSAGYDIRAGRQKVAEAVAENLAYTGRLKWTAVRGLEVAASVQWQDNITQGVDADASANLLETHVVWSRGPMGLRALYASWRVDGDGAKAVGKDEQTGFYVEPSYKITPAWGLFARYNQWDTAAGDAADSEFVQINAGVNFWPHERVVIKADYQNQSVPAGEDEYDGFNMAVGYQF